MPEQEGDAAAQAWVVRTNALRRTFVSVKGFYFQAEVVGQLVTWLVPHTLSQVYRLTLTCCQLQVSHYKAEEVPPGTGQGVACTSFLQGNHPQSVCLCLDSDGSAAPIQCPGTQALSPSWIQT